MNFIVRLWRPSAARVLVLALAIAAAPLPAVAGDSATAAKPGPSIRTSVEKVVATQTLDTARRTARAAQQGTTTDLGSSSFFKTPAGIVTLVAVAAGVGFALYSTSHDRVKSPNRPYGGG